MSPDTPLLHRSYLYTPGSDARMIGKALAAGADAVILDLEDAVAAGEKAAARRLVADVMAATETLSDVHVRINRGPTGFDEEDVRAAVHPSLQALRLPKVEDPDEVARLDDVLARVEEQVGLPPRGVALYPTVESAAGALLLADVLAASSRVVRVAFGATDFLGDVGARGDEDLATLHVRSHIVLVSRAAGIGPPVDSVHTRFDDDEGLRRAAVRARSLGFFGKSVIHPRQLAIVHDVFTPTEEELSWARRVLAALEDADAGGVGAVAVDGELVDAAVAARARSLLRFREAVNDTR